MLLNQQEFENLQLTPVRIDSNLKKQPDLTFTSQAKVMKTTIKKWSNNNLTKKISPIEEEEKSIVDSQDKISRDTREQVTQNIPIKSSSSSLSQECDFRQPMPGSNSLNKSFNISNKTASIINQGNKRNSIFMPSPVIMKNSKPFDVAIKETIS